MTLLVGAHPVTGVQAPSSLAAQPDALIAAFEAPDADKEPRRLHAKVLLFESDDWIAVMIGSSNATTAGYGLNHHHGHHELNLWIGCRPGSRAANQLCSLARPSGPLEIPTEEWDQDLDEDEPKLPVLPLGFDSCLVVIDTSPRLRLGFDLSAPLPEQWEVRTPAGREILTAQTWRDAGSPCSAEVDLPDAILPAYLDVEWQEGPDTLHATWTANVENRGALPPPAELAELPVDLLLAALSSTRPLPVALEEELRRRERRAHEGDQAIELDPLRRFDSSGMLLQRARHLSLALWRLQQRLGHPATSLDVISWRLNGAFGPVAIADGIVAAAHDQRSLPGEGHFVLAELALTVSAVDWRQVALDLDQDRVGQLVADVLAHIEARRQALPPSPDPALDSYALQAALPQDVAAEWASHPKVAATVDRVRKLWVNGEKSLVFCFYVETGRALRSHISRAIRQEIIGRAGQALEVDASDQSSVLAALDGLAERLLRSDTRAYRAFHGRIRSLVGNLDADVQRLVADVVIRFMRTPSFLVRYVDLSPRVSADGLLAALEADLPGGALADRIRTFAAALETKVEPERDELLAALASIQTGGISTIEDFDPSERARSREVLLPNVRLANGGVRRDTRRRLMLAFNTPFFPEILVASAVMAEGVDLQQDCRHVIHHDLDWNPSTLEQRTGRIDRIGSKAEAVHQPVVIYEPYLGGTHDEKMYRVVKDRERWFGVVMGQAITTSERATEQQATCVPLPSTLAQSLTMHLALG